jgi:ABC-type multidrug transport system fused ATPase/permease subunit
MAPVTRVNPAAQPEIHPAILPQDPAALGAHQTRDPNLRPAAEKAGLGTTFRQRPFMPVACNGVVIHLFTQSLASIVTSSRSDQYDHAARVHHQARPALRRPARQGGKMPLASSSYSYPILGAFWTIFMIFLWVIWFWILITIIIDIFRSHDLSGWAKALWFIFILFLPLIGVLVYLIARGGKMQQHAQRDAQVQEQQFRSYVQEAAGSQSTADQLAKLADLRDRGVITAEEFDREKAKVLA